MPTKREREYYRMGYRDGRLDITSGTREMDIFREGEMIEGPIALRETAYGVKGAGGTFRVKPKRKLSAWNKFVKANSKKPRFVLRSGKLNLKKMGVAFRKTPLGKKKRR